MDAKPPLSVPAQAGPGRGQPVAHSCPPTVARELLSILLRSGWTLRSLTPLPPCKKSALANNSRGDRDAPPTVIQALVAVVARTVPAIPSPLRESLVIHHYDVSKLTPAFRWDTVILEVPKPERVLPLTRGMYGLTAAEILRAQVEPWLLAPRSDPAAVLDWMRYNPNIFGPDGRRRHFRWEMGDISARYRHHRCELHPLEQGDRELRVWLDPFRPTSDAWFRVQFTPLHRDHQWFVGQLRTMLGEAWSHVRVVRLDAAFDFAGTVNDLVPIYERRRKPNRTEPMPTASGSHRSILCGSRRTGGFCLRLYDRHDHPPGGPTVRAEGEWKPRRDDRQLLSELPLATFPVRAPIELLPMRYLGRTPKDRELLGKVSKEGMPGLPPSELARLAELRTQAREHGVVFDYRAALRALWVEGLTVLRDLIQAFRLRPPPRWTL